MLEPFTTNAEVRATLGVTDEELEDETLDLPIYETGLRFELGEIGDVANDGALADAFDTIALLSESDRTSVQRRLYDAVILFSPFAVASHLKTAVPLFAAKAVTDGKAGVTRHAESPFKDMFKNVAENYDRFRQNLGRAWSAFSSSAVTEVTLPSLFRVSSPDTDPVVDAP